MREGVTVPESIDVPIAHREVAINETKLHYVEAGSGGTPVLLVHGFPETWWAFHEVIPLLAAGRRVIAVDLRGFGDSASATGDDDSAVSAEDLRQLIEHLGAGPVHLVGQDIGGTAVFRLAATHPECVRSFAAIEAGLPGFGLEALADVTHGGAWYIGVLAAPNIPQMLLVGRERAFIGDFAFPAMSKTPGAIAESDVEEFVRTYSRPGGWGGAIGLYRSMLREGEEIRALAQAHPLRMPVLAIGGSGGDFTFETMSSVTPDPVESVIFPDVGHYVAMEAPKELANALAEFFGRVEG